MDFLVVYNYFLHYAYKIQTSSIQMPSRKYKVRSASRKRHVPSTLFLNTNYHGRCGLFEVGQNDHRHVYRVSRKRLSRKMQSKVSKKQRICRRSRNIRKSRK